MKIKTYSASKHTLKDVFLNSSSLERMILIAATSKIFEDNYALFIVDLLCHLLELIILEEVN